MSDGRPRGEGPKEPEDDEAPPKEAKPTKKPTEAQQVRVGTTTKPTPEQLKRWEQEFIALEAKKQKDKIG